MDKETKVLMFIKHSVARAGLTRILKAEPNITIVGYVHENSQALRESIELKADILVIELDSNYENILGTLRKIKDSLPNIKMMVFINSINEKDIYELLSLGVSGYLNLESNYNEILSTFQATVNGKTVLSSNILTKVLDELRPNLNSEKLTKREDDILMLLSAGMSNKDISRKLFISESTIRSHVKHLKEKLNLKNRVEIANYAHSFR